MLKRISIKVCGMRDPQNVADVGALLPDYMGFIFYPPSPRYCGGIDRRVISSLPDDVTPVMVTVDLPFTEAVGTASSLGFTTLQLHGNESTSYCRMLRESGFKVWKTIPISSPDSLAIAEEYIDCVDMFLLDTSSPSKGGTGRKFDWNLFEIYDFPVDFILSGGIGEEDVEAVKSLTHPRLEGIDLNSRFEVAPGIKDTLRLSQFFNQIRNENYE